MCKNRIKHLLTFSRHELDPSEEEDGKDGATDQHLQLLEPVQRDLLESRDAEQSHVAI